MSYWATHKWIQRHFIRTGACERCSTVGRTEWAARSHENYTRERGDYMELCHRCHMLYDDNPPPSRIGTTITPEHIAALQAGRMRWLAQRSINNATA